jgi:hypothetical protein
MTWVHDDLAHVLEHADVDEPSGTWTGLACRDHELALGGDVDNVTLRHLAADGKIADLVWEASEELAAEHLQAFQAAMQAYHAGDFESAEQHWQELRAIWSRAWAASYAALELLQNAGITTFSPVKPQRWVIASFEHHCGPHGLAHPHVHNIVITRLTMRLQLADTGAPVVVSLQHQRWGCSINFAASSACPGLTPLIRSPNRNQVIDKRRHPLG